MLCTRCHTLLNNLTRHYEYFYCPDFPDDDSASADFNPLFSGAIDVKGWRYHTLKSIYHHRKHCTLCARFWLDVRGRYASADSDEEARRDLARLFSKHIIFTMTSYTSSMIEIETRFSGRTPCEAWRLLPGISLLYAKDITDESQNKSTQVESGKGLAPEYQAPAYWYRRFYVWPPLSKLIRWQHHWVIKIPEAVSPVRVPFCHSASDNRLRLKRLAVRTLGIERSAKDIRSNFKAILPWITAWLSDTQDQWFHDVFVEEEFGRDFMPTRLVKIDPDGKRVRVVQTSDLKSSVKYATLSHRWGELKFKTLTKENYDELQAGVSPEHLTRTFQDAISVCRMLGIDYIWIDSLCIFQGPGSEDDWAHEASRMHHIYGNSYLTIAATCSKDGAGGLFRQPRLALSQPCVIDLVDPGFVPIPRVGPASMGYTEHFAHREMSYAELSMMNHKLDFLRSTLFTRGWVVQEMFLSPRIIHFADAQIWWCSKDGGCRSEMLPDKTNAIMEECFGMYWWDLKPGNLPDRFFLDQWWNDLVVDFSRSDLSKKEDRIFAIAGLAQTFSRLYQKLGVKTTYVAGLFSHRLLEGLLWKVAYESTVDMKALVKSDLDASWNRQPRGALSAVGLDSNQEDRYYAPSWSWMSGDHAVVYGSADNKYFKSYASAQGDDLEVRVSRIEVEYDNPEQKFGLMRSAALHIIAPVIWCNITPLNEAHSPSTEEDIILAGSGWSVTMMRWSDTSWCLPSGRPLACMISFDSARTLSDECQIGLLIFRVEEDATGCPEIFGLILERSGHESGTWRRAGTWQIDSLEQEAPVSEADAPVEDDAGVDGDKSMNSSNLNEMFRLDVLEKLANPSAIKLV